MVQNLKSNSGDSDSGRAVSLPVKDKVEQKMSVFCCLGYPRMAFKRKYNVWRFDFQIIS